MDLWRPIKKPLLTEYNGQGPWLLIDWMVVRSTLTWNGFERVNYRKTPKTS